MRSRNDFTAEAVRTFVIDEQTRDERVEEFSPGHPTLDAWKLRK